MADDSGIDPRYAAQFQRGYDPAVHAVTPPTAPASPRVAPVRLAGGPVGTAERVPDRPAPRAQAPAPSPGPSPEASPSEGEQGDATEPAVRPRAEWALLWVGAALLIVAAGVLWSAAQQSTGQYAPGVAGRLWDSVRFSLPGPLVVAGVVSISAWVVLRALFPGAVASMSRRIRAAVAGLGGIAALLVATAIGIAVHAAIQQTVVDEAGTSGSIDIEALQELYDGLQYLYVLASVAPWLALGGLLVGVMALVVVSVAALETQRAASASSATASRDA